MASKIKFGARFANYPVPKKVKFFGRIIKIMLKLFAGTSLVMAHEYIALCFIGADQIVDECINFFGEEQIL